MKVLTLHQPRASLVALGVKTIETRSWSTKYRGPLAIHAAARKPRNVWAQEPPDLYDPIAMGRYLEVSEDIHGTGSFLYEWRGPLGAIVATCTLVDVVPIVAPEDNPFERYPCVQSELGFGDFPDGWLELYHPTLGNPIDPEGSGLSVPQQAPYGDFTPGRYAWLLADVVPVDPPVPFKGGQGLSRTWEQERAAA